MKVLLSMGRVLFRRLPYIFLWTLSLYGVTWLAPRFYYMAMPGSYWINLNEPVVAANPTTSVGKDVTFKLCRTLRSGPIKVFHTRSYYRIESGKQTPVKSYVFTRTYSAPKTCQYPVIPADDLPDRSGVYKVRTDLAFRIHGSSKTMSHEFTVNLTDTAQTLEERIQELEEQIYELKQQRGVLLPAVPTTAAPAATQNATTAAPAATQNATTAAPPPTLVIRQVTDPGKPTTPPSSAPPSPPAPAIVDDPVAIVPPEPEEPVNPQPIQGAIVSVLQSATGLVRDLGQLVL